MKFSSAFIVSVSIASFVADATPTTNIKIAQKSGDQVKCASIGVATGVISISTAESTGIASCTAYEFTSAGQIKFDNNKCLAYTTGTTDSFTASEDCSTTIPPASNQIWSWTGNSLISKGSESSKGIFESISPIRFEKMVVQPTSVLSYKICQSAAQVSLCLKKGDNEITFQWAQKSDAQEFQYDKVQRLTFESGTGNRKCLSASKLADNTVKAVLRSCPDKDDGKNSAHPVNQWYFSNGKLFNMEYGQIKLFQKSRPTTDYVFKSSGSTEATFVFTESPVSA